MTDFNEWHAKEICIHANSATDYAITITIQNETEEIRFAQVNKQTICFYSVWHECKKKILERQRSTCNGVATVDKTITWKNIYEL